MPVSYFSAELCFPGDKAYRLNENPELSEYFALHVDDMLNGFSVPEYKEGGPFRCRFYLYCFFFDAFGMWLKEILKGAIRVVVENLYWLVPQYAGAQQ